MKRFKDVEHLLRVAGVFLAGTTLFFAFRAWFVPKTFGQYGHYRGAAISEVAALPTRYAGHDACETCHGDVADTKHSGKHAGVNCEACHGALAKHAEDPAALKPVLPDTAMLCARCHEVGSAKPKWFPQVATAEHSQGLPCTTCHQPHKPDFQTASAQPGATAAKK